MAKHSTPAITQVVQGSSLSHFTFLSLHSSQLNCGVGGGSARRWPDEDSEEGAMSGYPGRNVRRVKA